MSDINLIGLAMTAALMTIPALGLILRCVEARARRREARRLRWRLSRQR